MRLSIPLSHLTLVGVGWLVPLAAQTFVDVTATSGLQNLPLASSTAGNGLCCADFDGDGDVDIVVPDMTGIPTRYFRNDGSLSFTELTGLGLGAAHDARGILAADLDNDGDQDIVIANHLAPIQLFVNSGNAMFTEEGAARGLTAQDHFCSMSCGDFDRDGWLDIYFSVNAGTNNGPNVLYRNTGSGYFQDVTAASGTGNPGHTYAAPFVDYDEDGWPDIYCVNDKGGSGVPNTILRNNGDGTFTDVGTAVNASQPIHGMGADFVDAFNDGGFDLFCSDDPVEHLFLRWNPGAGQYVDDTYTYGFVGGSTGWGVNWFDFDNDGWQDLQIVQQIAPNLVYHNPAAPAAAQTPWPEIGFQLGLASFFLQYTAMVADLDDDGGIDVVNRYTNNAVSTVPGCAVNHNQVLRGNWLKFRTRGVISNRDGIGARIEVEAGGMRQRQAVRSGVAFLSGNDKRVHFGLGTATQADRVTIYWPSGQVQQLDNIAANQVVEIVEPAFVLTQPIAVGGMSTLELSIQGDEGLLYGMVLAFSDTPHSQLPDGRYLPLHLDALSSYTFIPGNIFLSNPLNYLDALGRASSQLSMPNQPGLVGLPLFATAATVPSQGLPAIRTIFPEPLRFTIQ